MTAGLPVPGADTGGPVGRDGVETGAELIAGGPEGANRSADTWSQVEALAAILEPEAFDGSAWKSDVMREEYRARARHHAAKAITSGYLPAPAPDAELVDLIAGAPCAWSTPIRMDAQTIAEVITAAGYRRVSEDDNTIGDLAEAMHAVGCGCDGSLVEHQTSMLNDFGEVDPAYAEMAHAAVRALRDDPGVADPAVRHHDCCPHCTARTGSCVRCGVRDAADGEQLCGQCDGEVTAEVEQDRAVQALREET